MRTPEVPFEGILSAEELASLEESNPLALRLAEAIERRTAESENGIVVVFNRYNMSHVLLEVRDEKLIAEWKTQAKGIVFTGKMAFLKDGSVLGVSANSLYPTTNSSETDTYYDFDGEIDPTQPYKVEGSAWGPEFDKYEVPLNTVVQIAESGHLN
jgi:hypothetical protein